MHFTKNRLTALQQKQSRIPVTLKFLLLCWCFCLVAIALQAQQQKLHHPVSLNPLQDKLEYQGFTVRLIPTIDGYYGFDILKLNKLVLHQTENPLPAFGITERADAFYTAKWLIDGYRASGHFPRIFPPGFERQFQSAQPVNPSNQNQ